jgi:hypothetical protein
VNYIRSGGGTTTHSYTIAPFVPPPLYGDIEPVAHDCDVDGSDLAAWIVAGGIDITAFAGNFGETSCF